MSLIDSRAELVGCFRLKYKNIVKMNRRYFACKIDVLVVKHHGNQSESVYMFVGADKQAVGIDMLDTTACYSG
jgi:hypothetical protein